MWQKEKKDSSLVSLALLLALATIPTAVNLVVSNSTLAQSSADVPSFSLPQTVPNGTVVRIDGSSSMSAINQAIKERFEKQFSGATVEVAANGADAALKALQEGKIDIAAIGRGLTPEEKAQGLEQVRLRREKIAIVVSADNPFQGKITNQQFAKIFRGEITDWSELGGTAGKIRLIDRPVTSDVRQAFRDYPPFLKAEFATGSNATQLNEDSTVELVKQLGKDGIGYVLANQVSNLEGVRILKINNTLPDNRKYPFSQPLVYVYKKNSSLGVTEFLGFATNAPGKQSVEEALAQEAQAIATNISQQQSQLTATPTNNLNNATTSPSAEEASTAEVSSTAATVTDATTTDTSTSSNFTVASPTDHNLVAQKYWWLLLPISVLGVGGPLLWWLRRKPKDEQADADSESHPTPLVEGTASKEMVNVGVPSSNNANQTKSNLSPDVTNITSNQNKTENFSSPTGAGLAAEATLASKLSGRNSGSLEVPSTDATTFDLEAPVAVVNSSYAPLPDVPPSPSHLQPPSPEEIMQVTAAQTALGEQFANYHSTTISNAPNRETATVDYPPLPDIWEDITPQETLPTEVTITSAGGSDIAQVSSDVNSSSQQLNTTVAEQPELPTVELDAERPKAEVTETTNKESKFSEVTSPKMVTTVTEQPELPAVELDVKEPNAEVTNVTKKPIHTEATLPEVAAAVPEQPELPVVELEQPKTETTKITGNEFALPEVSLDLEAPVKVVNTSYAPLPDVWEDTSQEQVQATESEANAVEQPETSVVINTSAPELPDISETVLERVAQAAEFRALSTPTEQTTATISNLPEQTNELTSQEENSTIGSWAAIYGIDRNNHPIDETTLVKEVGDENSIVLMPRTPKWAYVSWQISDASRQALRQQGGSQFTLRLYDVTDIDLSYQTPVLVQQYECEETINDRYVAIPVSDRNYMAEIGYVTEDSNWLFLAQSEIVRVFSRPEHDFWFIADTELIIHGATEPGSSVTIGGHHIKLKPDGTFHLRIPFTDRLIEYVMTAMAADSEHTKSVRLQFSQDNPAGE